ncbi:hypothetical protein BKK81_05390 [Cupriavidus sp. USMAHM13]|nr:hypothetical protein BKK81_05390 [Cupriavidus sp. USMAHM13]
MVGLADKPRTATRKELQALAKQAGTPLSVGAFHQGRYRSRPKTNGELRRGLLETACGPGIEWKFRSLGACDEAIRALVAAKLGKHGLRFLLWEAAIRDGLMAYAEYQRLAGLKRRRPDDEAKQLAILEQATLDAKRYEQTD